MNYNKIKGTFLDHNDRSTPNTGVISKEGSTSEIETELSNDSMVGRTKRKNDGESCSSSSYVSEGNAKQRMIKLLEQYNMEYLTHELGCKN